MTFGLGWGSTAGGRGEDEDGGGMMDFWWLKMTDRGWKQHWWGTVVQEMGWAEEECAE